jgi:hypothetical protein
VRNGNGLLGGGYGRTISLNGRGYLKERMEEREELRTRMSEHEATGREMANH